MKLFYPLIQMMGLLLTCCLSTEGNERARVNPLPHSAVSPAGKVSKETLTSQKKKRTYYLFVPDSVTSTAAYPLLILLHGSGRNGLSLMDKWKDLAAKENIILAAPDASNSESWLLPEDGPEPIYDLAENLKAKYPINPHRVYLFGHSGGAVFALYMAMLESEYFAATAIHAGSWRNPEDFATINYATRKIPIATFVGDSDPLFPMKSVRATDEALQRRGFTHRLTVIKGHNHWYYDIAPEINRDAWSFLKGHELEGEPHYVQHGPSGQSNDVNALLAQINKLGDEANAITDLFNAKELELKGKNIDSGDDAEQIKRIAQEEKEMLWEGAAKLRQAADIANQASRMKIESRGQKFFQILAQMQTKRAEQFDALREQAEALLGGESPGIVRLKREQARAKAERLRLEGDELERQAGELGQKK